MQAIQMVTFCSVIVREMLVGCSLTVPFVDSMFSLTNHQMPLDNPILHNLADGDVDAHGDDRMLMLHADLIFQVFDSVDDEELVSLEDELPSC